MNGDTFHAPGAGVLRRFIEQTPVAIAMFDREMRYLAASRRWCDDYRLGEYDLAGRSHYQIFPEIDDTWKNIHRRCMDGECISADEDRFERIDGTVQWLRWEIRPWYAAQEEVGGILMFSEDITARKEAELGLEKERETFRNLTLIASDYFWEFDRELRFHSLSPVIEERSGFKRQYFVGKALWELPLQDATEFDLLQLSNAIRAHKHFRGFECRLVNDQNEERCLVFSGDPCFSINDEFLGYRGVAQDITERKASEERTRRQAMVFNSAQEGIVITDLEGRVVDANAAFEHVSEYRLDEIRGQNMRFIQSHRHERDFYQNMWRSLVETDRWQGEVWNRRKGGDVYLEWVSISTIRNDRGRPIAYVRTSIDLNRMEHAKSELERLAHHDALTDLPNRLLLQSRLEHAVRRGVRGDELGAVLFIDLDRFKQVNDRYGHKVGDDLLVAVTKRLLKRLRDSDTLARLGGDEFILLLEDIPSRESAECVAKEVLRQLHAPFDLVDGQRLEIGGSIGISLFPGDGLLPDQLIENADTALYRAKADGRGKFLFFDAEQDDS